MTKQALWCYHIISDDGTLVNPTSPTKTFHFILIKPSHYDDEGYVIQWVRSSIPSNTMAAIYGLARDCAERQILGNDVQMDITALDETNTRVKPRELVRMVQDAGGHALVAMAQGHGSCQGISPL
jgi:hypothetical protein